MFESYTYFYPYLIVGAFPVLALGARHLGQIDEIKCYHDFIFEFHIYMYKSSLADVEKLNKIGILIGQVNVQSCLLINFLYVPISTLD